jgi:hypothetical protein
MTEEIIIKNSPVVMTKKKYNELKNNINTVLDDKTTDEILKMVCQVLKFDPKLGIYNKELGQKMKEYQHRKSNEEGLSIYAWRKLHKKK